MPLPPRFAQPLLIASLVLAAAAIARPARAALTSVGGPQIPGGIALGASTSAAGDLDGDGRSDALAGAPDANGGAGRVYVFRGSASGGPALWPSLDGVQAGAHFGASVSAAGDVNGDGFADVVIGAPDEDNGATLDCGVVRVYLGSASGLSGTPSRVITGATAGMRLGSSVAWAGDVDRDGFDDIVIGAAQASPGGRASAGQAFLYRGSASGVGATAAWSVAGVSAGALLGTSVSTAGDANGDGFDDVIVGAPGQSVPSVGGAAPGVTYVFLGSASGLASSAWVTQWGEIPGGQFGSAVSTAGDANGDGYADWIVGAPAANGTGPNQGYVRVSYGSASGVADSTRFLPVANGWQMGASVAGIGDLNDDGYADIAFGEPGYVTSFNNVGGRAEVHLGTPQGVSAEVYRTLAGSSLINGHAGASVASAGDLDGDGFGDVVLGSPGVAGGDSRVTFYTGGDDMPATHAGWYRNAAMAGDTLYGYTASGAGDVNGDGYADVLVLTFGDLRVTSTVDLHLGGPAGLSTSPSQRLTTYAVNTAHGIGDVNGDGYDDVGFTSEPTRDWNGAGVFPGGPSGVAMTASWIAPQPMNSRYFFPQLAPAGDVNGDGYADVLFSTRGVDSTAMVVQLFRGGPAGLEANASWSDTTSGPNLAASNAPTTMAFGVGDLNGDGYDDVLTSNSSWPFLDPAGSALGRIRVYRGGPGGLSAQPDTVLTGTPSLRLSTPIPVGDMDGDGFSDFSTFNPSPGSWPVRSFFGGSAGLAEVDQFLGHFEPRSGLGDVDRDGFLDVLGERNLPNADVERVILRGGPNRTWTDAWDVADTLYDQTICTAPRGFSTTGVGDVNGDGRPDFSGSTTFFPEGNEVPDCLGSRVILYYGGPFPGRPRAVRRTNGGGGNPHLLSAQSGTAIHLLADALSPSGRTRLRMRYEVKPSATPFDGLGTQATAWFDTGTPAGGGSVAPVDQVLTGLTPGAGYHWRVRFEGRSPLFARSAWYTMLTAPETGSSAGSFVAPSVTDVAGGPPTSDALSLSRPRPNPSRGAVSLAFTLGAPGEAKLELFDLAGRRVRTLAQGSRPAGAFVVTWDGRDGSGQSVRSGLYYARLSLAGERVTRTLVRLN